MGKVAGTVLLLGAAAGGYFYLQQQQAQTEVQRVVYVPQPEPAYEPQQSKFAQIAPFLDFGMDLMNRNRSNNTTQGQNGLGGFLGDLFGGGNRNSGQGSGAPASGGRASVGAGGAQGILDMIGSVEAPQGYNQVYGGSKIQPPRPITTMTIRELLAWQDRSVAAGSKSSAAGRYQIIRKTLRSLVAQGAARMNDRFDRSTQDRLGRALLSKRGLERFEAGQMTASDFAQSLSQEWAALPAFTRDRRGRAANGQSYYADDGLNRSHLTKDQVLQALGGMV